MSLVERAPRRVMLTPIGHDIAAARAQGDRRRRADGRDRPPQPGPRGRHGAAGAVPDARPRTCCRTCCRGLRERFPRLELLLVEEKTDQILARLRDGRLDAGLLALPIHDDQLHVEPLFDEPFLLAVPQQHAMAKRGSLELHDLDDQHLLLLEEGHCLRDQALDVCRMAGADERDGFRATSLETLRQMVASGVGITLLPMLAVQPPVPVSPDIALLPFRGEAPHRRIAMLWRRSSAMGGFLQQLAAEFRKLPPALADAAARRARPPRRRKRARRARRAHEGGPRRDWRVGRWRRWRSAAWWLWLRPPRAPVPPASAAPAITHAACALPPRVGPGDAPLQSAPPSDAGALPRSATPR